jgi:O-antigen polysaccharide polymerase Wzy
MHLIAMTSNHNTDSLNLKKNFQQRYLKNLLNAVICILILGSLYLIDQRPKTVSLEKAFLAIGIVWVSLYPSLQYLADKNRPPMPFLPLIGMFYATSFGLPIFAGEITFMHYFSSQSVDATALILVLLGLVGMNTAFYSSKSLLWKRVIPLRLPSTYSLKNLLILIWVFVILHLSFLYFPVIQDIPSITHFLDPVGYIAYGMFFILWKRNLLPTVQKIAVIYLCIPMEIIPRLASGSLAQVMLLGFFMVIVAFFETKRLPIIFISLTLCIILVLNPIKGEFRQLTWFKGSSVSLSPIEKAQLFVDVAIKKYTSPKLYTDKVSDDGSAIARTAHIMLFTKVVEDTPRRVAYWQGETYLPLFTSFIPRFIFPDKPEERIGNLFGRRYDYLSSRDLDTSLNLPWIVEMYANFGVIGVIFGMSLVGIFLSFLEQKFNRPEMNSLEFVTGTTILFGLIYQESNFSLMVGGVFSLYLALLVVFEFSLGKKH